MSYEADDSVTKSVGQDKLLKELCDEANPEFAETDLVSAAADNLTSAVNIDSDIQLPPHESLRTPHENKEPEQVELESTSSAPGFDPQVGGVNPPGAAAEQGMEPLEEAYATKRAMAMFAIGRDESIEFVLTKVILVATISDIMVVKMVTHNVLERCGASIVRSPERPDLQLSKEEGAGYLLAALSGIELLAAEARATGKAIDKRVATEKSKTAKAKEKAKDSRKNARTAAKKSIELAAQLDAKLAGIDASEAGDRAARRGLPAAIDLPATNSVLVQQTEKAPPPSQSKVEYDPESILTEAECVNEAAELALSKAKRARGKITGPPSSDYAYYIWGCRDEEVEQRKVEHDMMIEAERAVVPKLWCRARGTA